MSATDMSMMSRIIFYEDKNFQGRSYECSSDFADMSSFLSRCQSCRVERGCFVVYDRINFMGNQSLLRKGDYPDCMNIMGINDCIKSCRMIPMYCGPYRIKIFERENFGGLTQELVEDCNNIKERSRMSGCMSCQVLEGHWLLYELPHYRGKMMYVRPGDHKNFMEAGLTNIIFMSMKRIVDSCY